MYCVSSKKVKLTTTHSLSNIPKNILSSSTIYSKSLSVGDLLHAGRILRSKVVTETSFILVFFDK